MKNVTLIAAALTFGIAGAVAFFSVSGLSGKGNVRRAAPPPIAVSGPKEFISFSRPGWFCASRFAFFLNRDEAILWPKSASKPSTIFYIQILGERYLMFTRTEPFKKDPKIHKFKALALGNPKLFAETDGPNDTLPQTLLYDKDRKESPLQILGPTGLKGFTAMLDRFVIGNPPLEICPMPTKDDPSALDYMKTVKV